jgi:hypothetical protein
LQPLEEKEIAMKTSIVLTALACVLGFAGASHAAQLASPTIYGAVTQNQARCDVGNTSAANANVKLSIVDESGNVVSSGCGFVEAGFICSIFANNIGSGVAYACVADVTGSPKPIRASFTLWDASENILRTADLR